MMLSDFCVAYRWTSDTLRGNCSGATCNPTTDGIQTILTPLGNKFGSFTEPLTPPPSLDENTPRKSSMDVDDAVASDANSAAVVNQTTTSTEASTLIQMQLLPLKRSSRQPKPVQSFNDYRQEYKNPAEKKSKEDKLPAPWKASIDPKNGITKYENKVAMLTRWVISDVWEWHNANTANSSIDQK